MLVAGGLTFAYERLVFLHGSVTFCRWKSDCVYGSAIDGNRSLILVSKLRKTCPDKLTSEPWTVTNPVALGHPFKF